MQPFPGEPESQVIQALRIIYEGVARIMTQNDQMSSSMTNLEGMVNSLLPEIQTEIQDLANALAQIANSPTPQQVQDQVARANALSAKIQQATAALQADNPAPAQQPPQQVQPQQTPATQRQAAEAQQTTTQQRP
jgi:hypothetical protein